MKKVCLLYWIAINAFTGIYGQSITDKLKTATATLENDQQLRHGILSLYVIDAKTGRPVFEKNAHIGLAPASTQKIITSVTSFELLGSGYQFKTYIRSDIEPNDGKLPGNLYFFGNGDPTLGSWRWKSTTEQAILNRITDILKKNAIKQIEGDVVIDDVSYTFQPVPDGWIWQDIGNYYGAGAWSLNWRENQYDLILQSGKNVGEATTVVRTIPAVLFNFTLANFITAGKKNSGDNGYIYAAPFTPAGFTTGTIPADEKSFTISGSMPQPALQFSKTLEETLKEKSIPVAGQFKLYSGLGTVGQPIKKAAHDLDSISSPTLDSINFWFLRKSVNLYGEALIKAMAFQQQPLKATTENGVEILRNFWSELGIEKSAINIMDGSGLSPQNRVTTHALVKVLAYAKTRSWFNSFYNALPTFNGMKIKSGSIGGARSYAGYHISGGGKEYIFAIIVNNYDGSSSEIVRKMYKLLDVLK
jgi:D-alanyl-D-alanine carboxypeptidase/D-alanyl-D-alanine-endopeptidase (penicillin-binding protein 4)